MPKYRLKKGQRGDAIKYMSRSKAARKLQLSLFCFTRLCIIKGIYPIEPKHRIRAQKGDSRFKTLYLKKDIKFLMHDPLMWTIRNENSSYKKLKSAKHLKSVTKLATIKRNKPIYRLDQNVLERYPSFLDAVKDLADPLTMAFMFSRLGILKPIQEHHITRCQRLCAEFLTYVIEARCLTKAFISTRGYYYEVEILGRRVVWMVPHNCVTTVPLNADLQVMRHFLEFYISMLGFVNFRLLGNVNFRYPLKPAKMPNFVGNEKKDLDNFKSLLLSLNYPMERTEEKSQDIEQEKDSLDTASQLLEGSTELTKKAYSGSYETEARKKLFEGLQFFIGTENNRESLTLVIRSCGGKVSWPKTVFPCSTFTEDDQCITHQIVDRPNFENKHLSRYYVQPQYVYDCLNAATLKPCQPYLPGADLPPHICPFLKNCDGWYVPPEEETLRKLLEASPEEKEKIIAQLAVEEKEKMMLLREAEASKESSDEDDSEDEDDDDSDVATNGNTDNDVSDGNDVTADAGNNDVSDGNDVTADAGNNDVSDNNVTDDENDITADNKDNDVTSDDDEKEEEMEVETAPIEEKKQGKNMNIRRGRELIINPKGVEKKESINDEKMRKFMIHPRNRNLYHKLQAREQKTERRSTYLKERREAHEALHRGEITQQQYDYPPKKVMKLTFAEKKKLKYKESVKSSVKFCFSKANKNRDK